MTHRVIELEDDLESINEYLYRQGWTDGLPVIPPTEERVDRMLSGTTREPDELIAVLDPRHGKATVRTIAANAVMAGCLPEYLPVVIAAVEAMAHPALNLYALLCSTHNASPLVLVNGPIGRELDINCGVQDTPNRRRASSAIGRAVVLITINVAGVPGTTHIDTHEPISRHYHCIAENEGQSPWEPLHVERGFAPEQSTVTVFAASTAQHLDDTASTSPQSLLQTLGVSVANSANRNTHGGGEPLFLLGSQHANLIGRSGWSKADIQRFLYDNARVRQSDFPQEQLVRFSDEWRKRFMGGRPDPLYPIAARPEDIAVVVFGGRGAHSLYVQTLIGTPSATVPIRA